MESIGAFLWVVIVGPIMYAQIAYNVIFDGFPIPFSDHVGKVVEVAPIANSQKIKELGEWEEKYSQLYIGEKVISAKNREDANFKKITTFQKYEVIREKLKTGRVLGFGSGRICILNNLNDSNDLIREDCANLDEVNSATEKYKSILQSINDGKIKYFAMRDVNPDNEFKKAFKINDYNIYELKDENQLNELINFILSRSDFPSYVNLSKLKEIIYFNQDDLKNDKVLSQLTLTNKNNNYIVTKTEKLEKIYSGNSDLLKQENLVEKLSVLNDKIAIRIYFNYFNQKIRDLEKISREELDLAFQGLEEIKNCLSIKYFSDQKLSSNIFKDADKIIFNTPELQSKSAIYFSKRIKHNIAKIYDCNNFNKFSEIKDE